LAGCREEISAAMADRNQRTLLQIERPLSLLVIKRQSYAANGNPIELSVTSYRGDMYTASIEAIRLAKASPLP
jgi:DNA-binding GntR family transcriptional regulator